jgi:glutamate carboxypeptidase
MHTNGSDVVRMNPDRAGRLLSFCQSEASWLRHAIETLVSFESPSDDKVAVDRCGASLQQMLSDIGGAVERIPQVSSGDHIRARWPARDKTNGHPARILLLGHFDTVWPAGSLHRMPVREVAGRLHGPGIFDMKSGIAAAMLAMRALEALEMRPLHEVAMLWTTDEEVGSGTSRTLIEEEARRSAAVLVLEPSLPDGAAKTSRKGVGEFEILVHGVAAHAGLDPGKGASAIHELARVILALETLQDPSSGITVNVGTITGGTRPNVVADRASARVDVRVATMVDAARLEAAIRGLRPLHPRVRVEVTGGVDRPPLERSAAVVRLYQRASAVAEMLGRRLSEGAAGGGSDGNFTAALGVPTLDGLGPRGDGAHALHEHVLVEDLPWRAAFLACLIASFG